VVNAAVYASAKFVVPDGMPVDASVLPAHWGPAALPELVTQSEPVNSTNASSP
jgi:hypothetical protein